MGTDSFRHIFENLGSSAENLGCCVRDLYVPVPSNNWEGCVIQLLNREQQSRDFPSSLLHFFRACDSRKSPIILRRGLESDDIVAVITFKPLCGTGEECWPTLSSAHLLMPISVHGRALWCEQDKWPEMFFTAELLKGSLIFSQT